MKALVIFCDGGEPAHPLAFLLKAGFRHCCVALLSGDYWLLLDGERGVPVFRVLAAGDFDLAGHYRDCGLAVVEIEQASRPLRAPLVLANCVGFVKAVLCIRSLAVTPFGLYRHLTKGERA